MTHDGLLAELKEIDHSCSVVGITVAALRAVVELHKPFDFKLGSEMFTSCDGCGQVDYPCPTTQAIEKKLK